MPAIPSIANFTGGAVTEGEFKTALSNLHLFLTGLLGTDGTQAGGQAALGALLGAGAVTKTAAYTVTADDRGRVIACSGSFTVTLPDASAVGAGFAVAVGNYGAGTIVVDPYSSQTIDGSATRTLAANTMLVACAVSGEWLTVGAAPVATVSQAGIVQLADSVISTSTTTAATANAVKAAYDLAYSKEAAGACVPKNMAHNAVGSLCLAFLTGAPITVLASQTAAGSALRPASAGAAIDVGSSLTGTWRCLGYASGIAGENAERFTTLWQRIS